MSTLVSSAPCNLDHAKGRFSNSADALRNIAQDMLAYAKQRGASAAAVDVSEGFGQAVTVRQGEVETIEYNRDKGLGITVYIGQQHGNASTSDFSPQAVRDTVDAALSIARYTAKDDCSGLPDADMLASDWPDLDLYHPWDLPVDDAMERDYWYSVARDAGDLQDAQQVGRIAAERTVRRLNARQLDTMQVPVLFEAPIASSLLGHFTGAVSGGSLYRKSSFLLDHMDKPVFAPHINIEDIPDIRKGLASSPFDDEGVRVQRRTIVENGVLRGYFLGSYSARKLGMRSTGNSGGNHNLILKPSGGQSGELDFAGLLKTMSRGLLVTELLGSGVNNVTGDYSRGAAGFWVEHGEIQYPVQEITIAGDLKDMFRNIVAVGNDILVQGSRQCGSILLEGMTVAGR